MLEHACADAYLRVKRSLVSDGALRKLWERFDRARCLAPLIPLALNARGRASGEAFIGLGTLRARSGLSGFPFVDAMITLESRFIERLRNDIGPAYHYRLLPGFLAESGEKYFVLSSRLEIGGLWSSLSNGERTVLIALAAAASPVHWDIPEYSELMISVSRSGMLSHLRDFETIGCEYSYTPARRVGFTSLSGISQLTGMTRSAVSRSLKAMECRGDIGLLHTWKVEQGFWYQLPERRWGSSMLDENNHSSFTGTSTTHTTAPQGKAKMATFSDAATRSEAQTSQGAFEMPPGSRHAKLR